MLLLLLIQFCSAYNYLNHWFPVLPLSSTDFSNPQSLQILGKDFVIWKKDNKLICQDDICPHRLAPLSEGYIDSESKNLRCAYHGWEFNECGNCTVIPQLDISTESEFIKTKGKISTYPVIQYEDILWVFLDKNISNIKPFVSYYLSNSTKTFMREVPYSFYMVLENFFDPAHIPFAHHKLQSVRSKGCPININLLWNDKSLLSVMFQESPHLTNNSSRAGIMEFQMPCYYRVTMLYPTYNLFKHLHLFVIPIQEDKTRLLIKFELNRKNKIGRLLFQISPTWLKHVFINIFLDSDTLILYKQERHLKTIDRSYTNRNVYFTPSQSDKAVILYKKWISKHLPTIPFFKTQSESKELTREEVLDKYNQHTKHCIHCKRMLTLCRFFQEAGTFMWGKIFSQTKNPFFLLLTLGNYVLFGKMLDLFKSRDYKHSKIK